MGAFRLHLFQHSQFVVFCLHVRLQIWSVVLHMCCIIYGVFDNTVSYGELSIITNYTRNHGAFQTCPGLFQGWFVDRADYNSLTCLLLSLGKVRTFGVATRHAECFHSLYKYTRLHSSHVKANLNTSLSFHFHIMRRHLCLCSDICFTKLTSSQAVSQWVLRALEASTSVV